jgi:cytochrome b subunit of formate dehydrogenase
MVTTELTGYMGLWVRVKIPQMKDNGESDDWWTYRETIFWTSYVEERKT